MGMSESVVVIGTLSDLHQQIKEAHWRIRTTDLVITNDVL